MEDETRDEETVVGNENAQEIHAQEIQEVVAQEQGNEILFGHINHRIPQQAGERFELPASIVNNLLYHVNIRMLLSPTEHQRALAIKQAVTNEAGLNPLTDSQYVQLALVDLDNINSALERVRHMQIFREEYGINDTFEQGMALCRDFIDRHPGSILSIAYNTMEGNYCGIYDQSAFDQNSLQLPKDWKNYFGFVYYLYQAMNPDFHAMRRGVILIAECEGQDWKDADLEVVRRTWSELLTVYPVNFREIKLFHTGLVANLSVSLMKQYLPERIFSKFNLGCQFEGRLDSYYMVPSIEEANERIMGEMETFLRLRFHNESSFSL